VWLTNRFTEEPRHPTKLCAFDVLPVTLSPKNGVDESLVNKALTLLRNSLQKTYVNVFAKDVLFHRFLCATTLAPFTSLHGCCFTILSGLFRKSSGRRHYAKKRKEFLLYSVHAISILLHVSGHVWFARQHVLEQRFLDKTSVLVFDSENIEMYCIYPNMKRRMTTRLMSLLFVC